AGLDVRLDRAARVRRWIAQPHDRRASDVPLPPPGAGHFPLPNGCPTPQHSRNRHDADRRAEGRAPGQKKCRDQHERRDVPFPLPRSPFPEEQAECECNKDEEYRRPHARAASADYISCTDFAPQRGASATLRSPSSRMTSSFARSWSVSRLSSVSTSPWRVET